MTSEEQHILNSYIKYKLKKSIIMRHLQRSNTIYWAVTERFNNLNMRLLKKWKNISNLFWYIWNPCILFIMHFHELCENPAYIISIFFGTKTNLFSCNLKYYRFSIFKHITENSGRREYIIYLVYVVFKVQVLHWSFSQSPPHRHWGNFFYQIPTCLKTIIILWFWKNEQIINLSKRSRTGILEGLQRIF